MLDTELEMFHFWNMATYESINTNLSILLQFLKRCVIYVCIYGSEK